MADYTIKAGTTSKMIATFLADNSVGSGAGLTGLTSSSTNLNWYYYREGAGSGATQVTLANPTLGTWSSGGFKAIDGTNMPGMYELHIPDAAIAAGAKWVKFYVFEKTTTALNLAPRELTIDLVAYDPYDAVRLGLTAMPNVASGSAGAIITSGTGTAQLSVTSGVAQADATKIGGTTQTGRDIGASVLLSSGTGTGQLDFTSGVVKANATQFAGQTITCSGGVTVPAATLASTTNITAGTITTVTTVTNQLTAAQIATGVWQDATAGDFTTASSIGKSLYTGNVAPGGSGGLLISGSNSGTTTLAALAVTGGITVSNSGGTAMTLTGSANGHGLVVQGNGTGNGMTAIGGATGAGIKATGGSTSGDAIYLTATSGYGVDAATIGFLGDIGGSMNGTVGSVTGSVGSVVTKTGYSLASTGLDLVLIDGIGLPTAVKYVAAATAGKSAVSGSTVTFTGIDGSTLHITATTDSNGQRTAVAYS